jgi:hypothetical protein
MTGMDSIGSSLNYALQRVKNIFHVGNYPTTMVKSNVDGQMYNVRDLPDKQEAADMMAKIRLKIYFLKSFLK